MSDLPLDETALQAAAEHIWPSANLSSDEAREDLKRDVRAAISTYLREAGLAGLEGLNTPFATSDGSDDPLRCEAQAAVMRWLGVVQAESEEERDAG